MKIKIMAQKIIPLGKYSGVAVNLVEISTRSSEISFDFILPAQDPPAGDPGIPGCEKVTLDTNLFLSGFSNVTFTDTGSGTVRISVTLALTSKKPGTAESLRLINEDFKF